MAETLGPRECSVLVQHDAPQPIAARNWRISVALRKVCGILKRGPIAWKTRVYCNDEETNGI
jgi:hypothetical protein